MEMKRLKIYFAISVLCMIRMASHAQESSLPEGFTTSNTVWVIRIGGNLNNVTGSGVDDTKTNWAAQKCYGEFKNTFGGNASFGLYSPLGTSPIYIGINAGVGMRGYKTSAKWKEDIGTINSQETRLTAFNAQISPFNIGYIAKLTKNTALDFHVGVFFTYDFAGTFTTEEDYSDNTRKKNSIDINDTENYNKYDTGVIGGIGFWYNHWNVNIDYQRGFSSIYNGGADFYSKIILLSLGYAF